MVVRREEMRIMSAQIAVEVCVRAGAGASAVSETVLELLQSEQ